MYSVLHISDLHRSRTDPIDNDELLSTLVADADHFAQETPQISLPDAIVLSGDLVQGVALDATDPSSELERQYEVAADFLDRLTQRFLDGDRSRVVIVAGNHDVSWPVARSAMEPATTGDNVELDARAFGADSPLRWSWTDRQIYQIVDRDLYERRLDHYRTFVQDFYKNAALPYAVESEHYFQLFELFEGRIGVAGFNSCAGNDCFSRHGAIPDGAIGRAHLALRDKAPTYDLLMSVWHHNVEGDPYTSDYMDVAAVYQMISKGFRLGLHGHQHRAQATHRTIHLPEQQPMAIVSAGSLCAGRRQLPVGVNRQYNIIELNDELSGARVHVREMSIATAFAPARRAEFGGNSFVDLEWGAQDVTPSTASREHDVVLTAEAEHASGDHLGAIATLRIPQRPRHSPPRPRTLTVHGRRYEAAKQPGS